MSNLLIVIAFSAIVILTLTTIPANAAVKGTITAAGGSKCDLREISPSGSTVRRLRLNCQCQDKEGNNVDYQCYYISDIAHCCHKSSIDHYHSYVPAYYAQAADQIKGRS